MVAGKRSDVINSILVADPNPGFYILMFGHFLTSVYRQSFYETAHFLNWSRCSILLLLGIVVFQTVNQGRHSCSQSCESKKLVFSRLKLDVMKSRVIAVASLVIPSNHWCQYQGKMMQFFFLFPKIYLWLIFSEWTLPTTETSYSFEHKVLAFNIWKLWVFEEYRTVYLTNSRDSFRLKCDSALQLA